MKKYIVKLTDREEQTIQSVLEGRQVFSIRNRAQALRFSSKGLKDKEIADLLELTARTICNIRKRCCSEGLEKALFGKPRTGRPKKFNENDQAELTALACSAPPEGRERWTLELLRKHMSKPIGKSMVHLLLKKTKLSPG